jgi:hypothetical protein
MEPEGSLPCSQEPATCPYPEPNESNHLLLSGSLNFDEMGGHVELMGEMRSAYGILVGEPEGKRPLGRPRHRQDHNIIILA